MKKLFVTIVTTFFFVITSYAQTTFNVRAGGGILQTTIEEAYRYYDTENYSPVVFTFDANIPLGARTQKFVFSPSLSVLYELDESAAAINIPLHIGYKVPLGKGSIFVPQIGPMIGFNGADECDGFLFGPSTEFSFEIKHFVVAANFYLNLIDEAKIGAYATIGYKF